ncbi:uncharacterized protein LOC126791950 [Argentina anserina]|uniref:uncharacterized protein LOC126791950 n=1 Tax=Argentina anserina TaxID=57926 RepID=UPI0021761E17|nr:uncharacterized protein LOC126791950 [Potentilla anserina]
MCRGCSVYLCGLYFTCVACFDGADHNTYDLCAVCYRNWNFNHHHSYFLDNHILLRAKRCIPPPPSCSSHPAMAPQPQSSTVIYNSYYVQPTPQRRKWYQAFRLLEAGLATANLVTNCAIM